MHCLVQIRQNLKKEGIFGLAVRNRLSVERFSKPNIRFGSGRTGSKIVSKFRLTHNRKLRSANRNTIDHTIACPALLLWCLAAENRGPQVSQRMFFVKLCKSGGLLLPSPRSLVIPWPTSLAHSFTDDGHVPAEVKKFIVSQVEWKLQFGLVRLRINPRRCEAWCELDEVTREKLSNTWQRSDRTSVGRFCDRHEVKPNRKFDSVRGLVDRNFRTVRPRFSIQFSISSPVIVRNRRIEPKFGLLNLSTCISSSFILFFVFLSFSKQKLNHFGKTLSSTSLIVRRPKPQRVLRAEVTLPPSVNKTIDSRLHRGKHFEQNCTC